MVNYFFRDRSGVKTYSDFARGPNFLARSNQKLAFPRENRYLQMFHS